MADGEAGWIHKKCNAVESIKVAGNQKTGLKYTQPKEHSCCTWPENTPRSIKSGSARYFNLSAISSGVYAITYFDPEDEEGMRVKTWTFGTLGEAEAWRGELGVVWREPELFINKL